MQSIYQRLGNGEAQRRDEHHMELHLERALDNNNNITITISFANGNVSVLISSLDDEGCSTMVVEVTMKWKKMEKKEGEWRFSQLKNELGGGQMHSQLHIVRLQPCCPPTPGPDLQEQMHPNKQKACCSLSSERLTRPLGGSPTASEHHSCLGLAAFLQ